MSAWAKPGVKCVCVDYKRYLDPARWAAPALPPKGAVVVIRATETDSEGRLLLFIEGHPNYSKRHGCDVGFLASRFRPLITRTQSEDVALFRKLLVTEGADA